MHKNKRIISLLCSVLTFATCFNINIPGNIKTVHAAESTYTYNFTGAIQTFTAPQTGKYHFEINGAQGGGARFLPGFTHSGNGGHTTGYLVLRQGETIYIAAGGSGTYNSGTNAGGYNGGGTGYNGNGSGGGATSITKTPTLLKDTTDSNIIAVAGGGGGAGKTQTGMYAGSGGGDTAKDAFHNLGATQTSGNARGYGGNGTNGGAGGGGYWGGKASNLSNVGGGGGSGYYSSDVIDGTSSTQAYMNSGNAIISYVGPATPTLIVSGGGVGKVNGDYYLNLVNKADTTITLPTPVAYINQENVIFNGYKVVSGDGTLKRNSDGTYSYTYGIRDSEVEAVWTSRFNVVSNRIGNKVIFKINADNYENYSYFVEQSFNRVTWDPLLEDGTSAIGKLNGASFGSGTFYYTIPIKGWYRVYLRGGGGGEDGGAPGGSGASISGDIFFNKNHYVTFYGGGRGQDSHGHKTVSSGGYVGGAEAFWSGGGGGGYFVQASGTDIMGAGGGGGSTNGASGHGGRVSWDNSHNTGSRYGSTAWGGERDFDGGGGGGGWVGGQGGKNEDYDGGDGGYGGRNGYIGSFNGHSVKNISEGAGQGAVGGNWGNASITPVVLMPYNDNYEVTGILKDIAAPNKPINIEDNIVVNNKEGTISFKWGVPDDNGTTNFFRAARITNLSNFASDKATNEEDFLYTSGLKGYYYVLDHSETTKVTKSNTFVENSNITLNVNLDDSTPLYFHVAAVDNAGNLGETLTLSSDTTGPNIFRQETMPIYTNKITISSNVKNYHLSNANSNTYWVQGSKNKESKFNLSFEGFAKHEMRENYQINQALYDVTLKTEKQNIKEYMYNTVAQTGVYNTTTANGGEYLVTNRVLDFNSALLQRFKWNRLRNTTIVTADAEYDNQTVTLVPEARAVYTFNAPGQTSSRDAWEINGKLHNGAAADELNKINLIIDSTTPTVTIPDEFKEDEITHRVPLITEPTTFPVSYVDYVRDVDPSNPEYGSGVTDGIGNITVIVTQEQTDDGGPSKTKIYNENTVNKPFKVIPADDKSGRIDISIDPYTYEEMSGFIKIKVEITDNVGNTVSKEYRFLVMTLNTEIERAKTLPAAEYFKGGEHGSIKTETNGFIDQIEYIFPSALDSLAAEEKSNAGNIDNAYWHVGRVLSDTYPRDESGKITRVTKNMQTQFWGSEGYRRIIKKGGMEWNGNDYVHSYLEHFFYVPLYTGKGTYKIVVTMYKQDPLYTENIYSTSNILYLGVGVKPEPSGTDVPPDTPDPITDEIRDTIEDN